MVPTSAGPSTASRCASRVAGLLAPVCGTHTRFSLLPSHNRIDRPAPPPVRPLAPQVLDKLRIFIFIVSTQTGKAAGAGFFATTR